MERRRAAGALLALAACILCTAAAPTASNHTALDIYDGQPEGCYYNFQHYGEGDRIMTNEPCLNCTCHNRMLMCYLRVCPFTKPIGQDCTVEKRADQCCPIVTCPDVPVDLLTLTSTTSPAEYGATGIGKLDKYGCSINGKYFPEGSKVPPSPNKPCEHCYCIRNMTTCVMQECTLHVDGCTPIYHKDVCCPVRYSCDHPEDEILLLDDKTTTVRPTPGFLLTTTTSSPVTQLSQDCVHDDQIFPDGASIKTEKSCEHCYCMKGDIVCVVQDCGTPMENEGKNCTALPPREGQCCPDTYICEGDELSTDYTTEPTTETAIQDLTTLTPPRRVGVEGSGYRKEPDNIPYTERYPTHHEHEGSGDSQEAGHTLDVNDVYTTEENTKYSYTTIPSIETSDHEDIGHDHSQQPTDSTDANIPDDHAYGTQAPEIVKDTTHAEIDMSEATTSSIPSYDHKLETSQPEVQTITEKQSDKTVDKTLYTTEEQKEITTAKTYEEYILTDAVTSHHDKYYPTTASSISEDDGITTETDREQPSISTGTGEEHSYEPGVPTASTTSAPFLEEVEGTSSSTYGQHVVTDSITESDIYDPSKNKADLITPHAAEVTDNVIGLHKDYETTEHTTLGEHEYIPSTTSIPTSDVYEKTTIALPEDLTTSKSSDETYEDDKFISTSTSKPVSETSDELSTDALKETSASSESSTTASGLIELDVATDKAQTEKYNQVSDEKMHEQYDNLATKASEEPTTISSIATSEISKDTDDTSTPSAPIQDDHLTTMVDKDSHETQQDSETLTKPSYTENKETATTEEIKYDISTEKITEQQDYESQKSSSTSTPISDDFDITTTEFIRDQDFVTSGPTEQESVKPSDFASSTLSTPFLEEIEKLTTETSHGYVVTDIITEKEYSKQPDQVSTVSEIVSLGDADVTTSEPDKGLNTIPSGTVEVENSGIPAVEKTTQADDIHVTQSYGDTYDKGDVSDVSTASTPTQTDSSIVKDDKIDSTTEPSPRKEDKPNVDSEHSKQPELVTETSYDTSSSSTGSFDQQEKTPSPQPAYEVTQGIEENVLSTEPTEEPSLEISKPEKEIKPEVDEVVASTQVAPSLPEVTTVNVLENEIDEDNLLSPGRIPGEGDCLLNGVTYRNETAVPSTNKCHSDCRCISSIIRCNPIICSPPPEYMDNCQPTYDTPDSCCPSYVCDQFRETLPPMPHVHITTTELPQQTSSIDCRGDQCEIHEDKIEPVVSVPVKDCINGECKHPEVPDTSAVQCEGEKCETSPVTIPHAPACEEGEKCKEHKAPETISQPCEGDDCKGIEENVVKDCADESCRRKETSDIEAKPSSCTGQDCGKVTEVETSTSSGTLEIKTDDTPKVQISDTITTEETIHQTILPEKQDTATQVNDLDTTVFAHPTEVTASTVQVDSQKVLEYTVTQEEPEPTSTDKKSITETSTKLPKLESDNDVLTTKIDEYATEKEPIGTDAPQVQTQGQQTFETRKPEDHVPTEPSKHAPDVEENTIKIITDEEIVTKYPTTVESDETVAATAEPVVEHKKHTTELPEQEGVTDAVEPYVTKSQERATSPEPSVTEIEHQTDAPAYTVSKSEDITSPPTAEISQDTTTEYYTSAPKATTIASNDINVITTQTIETATDIQKGEDKIYTNAHESATEPQSASSGTLSTSTDKENALPTKADLPITEDISKTTDEVTENNLISFVTDEAKEPEKQETMDTELPEGPVTKITDSTTESSIKEHEVQTEHEPHISLPGDESTSIAQKDSESTPSPVTVLEDIPAVTISDQDVSEHASPVPDKSDGETLIVTRDYDSASTEPSDFSGTTKLESNAETSQVTEKEQTEKSEKPSQEHVTDIPIEYVTMIDKTTEHPEILSHKKEPSLESPVAETEKKTTIEAESIDVSKHEEPSTEKTIPSVTTQQEPETEKTEHATEEPLKKDETIEKDTMGTTPKSVLEHEESSTVETNVSELEKSTENEKIVTTLPESHETEASISVKQEPTTITPSEKETVSGSPDMIPITDKQDEDVKVDVVDTSTDIVTPGYVSPVSYEPETKEPEVSYSEKTEEGLDYTTKSYEAVTNEKTQEKVDMPTSEPAIHEVATEEIPVKEIDAIQTETPGVHDTTESKQSEVTTTIPDKHIDQDLSTKNQDAQVTEIQELITEIPETQTLVTESQDISKGSDPHLVTEYQKPVTQLDESLATEHPDIKEPVKQTEEQTSITDAIPDVTEIGSIDVTQHPHERTTVPELSEPIEVTEHPHEKITVPKSSEPIDVTEHSYEKTTIPESSEPIDVTQHPQERTTVQESSESVGVTEHPHERTTIPESSEPIEITQHPHERTTVQESSEAIDVTELPHEKTTISESSEPIDVTQHPHERTTVQESSEFIDVTEHPHERTTILESLEPIEVTQHPYEKTTLQESSEAIDVTAHPHERITISESSEPLDVTQHPHEKTTVQESSELIDVTEHPYERTTVSESSESIEVTQHPHERTTIKELSEALDVTEHPHERTTIPESSEPIDVTQHPHERTTVQESSESIDVTEHPYERTTVSESSEPIEVTQHPHERTTIKELSEAIDVTEHPYEKTTVPESSVPIDVTQHPHERTTIQESSEAIDVTEHPDERTTISELSIIEPVEISTAVPQDVTETGSAELFTEEPVEATSRIPESHKVGEGDTAIPSLEPLTPVSKPSDETYTVKDEKPTETTQGVEISTELPSQPASESYDTSEHAELTSAPVHEVPETTPYLIELQEHTHKVQEATTTTPIEEEGTTEQSVSGDIDHQHHEPELTTETILDQDTDIKEPTKHYEETSTPLETLEKTTQVPISKDEESLPTTQSAHVDIKDTTEYKDKEITTLSPTQLTETDKEPIPEKEIEDVEKTITTSARPIQSDIPVEITTPEDVAILSTEKATTAKAEELPTQAPTIDKVTKPEEKPVELPTPSTDLSKPGPGNIQPTDEVPSPDDDGHFPSGSAYGTEPDYGDEDQAFGPGTCRYGGKVYVSAQQIPRDDPCDFCFCFRSDIICLQQSCPPPIHGCHEEPIQGFCCPRYECPVSMATTLNVTTTTTTTTTTLPPHFPTHSYKGAAQRRGCQIKGHTYKVGEVVRGSSGPCLHCTCGGDGQMKCDPKACTPEPMLRQMIAAAVSAKRRR